MSYNCEFCKKEFSNERILLNHLCEPRRRWLNRDEQYVRLGFNAWLRWYELTGTHRSKKKRTYEDFMASKYYTAFTKFGKHIVATNLVNPLQFLDYVIKNGIKLDNWCNDSVYEHYVRDVCKREDVVAALERLVHLMEKWSEENDEPWNDFFKKVNPNQAIRWIKAGRISPWIIFNANTIGDLFDRMSEEQIALVENFIETPFWKLKMMRNPRDTKFVQETLEKYGI